MYPLCPYSRRVALTEWLALAVFPGGLVILSVTSFWLSVGLIRQRRNLEATVVFVAFLGLSFVVWTLYRFFTGP